MDLGLAFEDEDLQCDEKNMTGDRDVPYNVKICSDQWFDNSLQNQENSSEEIDLEQYQTMLKFSADYSYREKDYLAASKKYHQLLESLTAKTCSALRHDAHESLSRSYMHSGQTEKGLAIAKEMVNASLLEDEARQRQALALLSFACEKAQKWAECVEALEKLCEMQPYFPQTWQKLGDIYNHCYIDSSVSDTPDDILLVKQLSSYLRAKLLVQAVMGTASEFIMERNIAMMQQLDVKINQIQISDSRKEFASEIIKKEMENQASTNKDSSCDGKVMVSNEPPWGTFYEKFCSWNFLCKR